MERLLRPVMSSTSSSPAADASSRTYWMAGLSTTGSISFGVAFVAGRNLVPRPAAGTTAFVTRMGRTLDGRWSAPEADDGLATTTPRTPDEQAVKAVVR